jgi:YD repeat-containing protein
VLDSGSTQLYQYAYNALGNVTQTVDPLGRTMSYTYDPNGIDLLQINQTTGSSNDLLMSGSYNGQHLPLAITDASGQTTRFVYNTSGQVFTITDPLSETTTFTYGSTPSGNDYQRVNLITGPVSGATTTLTYDGQQRLSTVTDSEGYTLTYGYDAIDGNPLSTLNRVSKVTYPDGTYEQTLYSWLDPAWTRDRLGRWTQRTYDALRHLTSITDPANRSNTLTWCDCGALESIQDANGNKTTFLRDLESRVSKKI